MKDIMEKPPVTASPKDPAQKVLDDFRKYSLWNIPVTDNGKYLGFISRSRLLSEYRKKIVDMSED